MRLRPRRRRCRGRAAATELLAAARPDDGPVSLLVAPMVAGNRELIAGLVRDPQFGLNVMCGVGGILAEAVGDVVFCPVPLSRVDAEDLIDAPRDPGAARALPRRAGGRPGAPGRRAGRALRRWRRPDPIVAVGRRQPADRRRRRAARRRRPGGAGALTAAPALDERAVPRPVRAARRRDRRRVHPPGQVRLRVAPQPAGRRLRGPGLRHQPGGPGGARRADRRVDRRAAGRPGRPRVRVHPGLDQPRPAAGRARPRGSAPRS